MLDAKADLVVFGMGEHQIVTIANRLVGRRNRQSLKEDMRGVAYAAACQRVAVASDRRDCPAVL